MGNPHDKKEWTWIFKEDVEIENFHIKSGVIVGDNIVMLARGKPRNTYEQCCSFLLVYKLIIKEGNVIGFDPKYTYIKLDPTVYAEFKTMPFVFRPDGDQTIIEVMQEDNFSEHFPRQLL